MSFCVQCSSIATAALTIDRVLHFLLQTLQFYCLSCHAIDSKRLFQRNIDCYIILKNVLLPNTSASQQYKYLKNGGREPISSKKNDTEVGSSILRGESYHIAAGCCQCELFLEWPARILDHVYLLLVITAASKQIYASSEGIMKEGIGSGHAQNKWVEVSELFTPVTSAHSFGAMHAGNLHRTTLSSIIILY